MYCVKSDIEVNLFLVFSYSLFFTLKQYNNGLFFYACQYKFYCCLCSCSFYRSIKLLNVY